MAPARETQLLGSGMDVGLGVGGTCEVWEPVTPDVSELGAGLDTCFHLLFIEHTLLKPLQGAGCYSKRITTLTSLILIATPELGI